MLRDMNWKSAPRGNANERTAHSQRDKDLMGVDGGQKVPRNLCGEPRFLTPEEIEALGYRPAPIPRKF